MKKHRGFTLIELMIVIAILGILIAIALPAYQDYSIRTKNTECLNVASAAKLASAEYRQSEQAYPASNTQAGYTFTQTDYCDDIQIVGEVITATTRNTGGDVVFTLTANLAAGSSTGSVTWICASSVSTSNPGWVPKECRN
jgi:type IV pilus assembly protein PilA